MNDSATSITGPSPDLRLASKLCIDQNINIVIFILLQKASLKEDEKEDKGEDVDEELIEDWVEDKNKDLVRGRGQR